MLFTNQALAYAAKPGANGVYEQRAYLETRWSTTTHKTRKYITVTTNTPGVA